MSHEPASPEDNRAPPARTRLIPQSAKKFVPSVPPVPIVSFGRATILLMRRYSPREPEPDRMHPASQPRPESPAAGAAGQGEQIAAQRDEVLRELATPWGFTQIMGYHVLGRGRSVRDLLDPGRHYGLAVEMLAEFAHDYQLDLGREFEPLFRCWNTGQPHGKTYDPAYAGNGLRRVGR